MRYKIPARLASLTVARLESLMRAGLIDVAPFYDSEGRAVIVLSDRVNRSNRKAQS